jgi:hypothetical protein
MPDAMVIYVPGWHTGETDAVFDNVENSPI